MEAAGFSPTVCFTQRPYSRPLVVTLNTNALAAMREMSRLNPVKLQHEKDLVLKLELFELELDCGHTMQATHAV